MPLGVAHVRIQRIIPIESPIQHSPVAERIGPDLDVAAENRWGGADMSGARGSNDTDELHQ